MRKIYYLVIFPSKTLVHMMGNWTISDEMDQTKNLFDIYKLINETWKIYLMYYKSLGIYSILFETIDINKIYTQKDLIEYINSMNNDLWNITFLDFKIIKIYRYNDLESFRSQYFVFSEESDSKCKIYQKDDENYNLYIDDLIHSNIKHQVIKSLIILLSLNEMASDFPTSFLTMKIKSKSIKIFIDYVYFNRKNKSEPDYLQEINTAITFLGNIKIYLQCSFLPLIFPSFYKIMMEPIDQLLHQYNLYLTSYQTEFSRAGLGITATAFIVSSLLSYPIYVVKFIVSSLLIYPIYVVKFIVSSLLIYLIYLLKTILSLLYLLY